MTPHICVHCYYFERERRLYADDVFYYFLVKLPCSCSEAGGALLYTRDTGRTAQNHTSHRQTNTKEPGTSNQNQRLSKTSCSLFRFFFQIFFFFGHFFFCLNLLTPDKHDLSSASPRGTITFFTNSPSPNTHTHT